MATTLLFLVSCVFFNIEPPESVIENARRYYPELSQLSRQQIIDKVSLTFEDVSFVEENLDRDVSIWLTMG